MNVLTTTWRQLVRSRLWPVALLLVAALAAVPLLLGRDPEPAPAAPASVPSSGTKASASLAEPVVDPATPEDRSRRRRVLGIRKDPFMPDSIKHPKKVKKHKANVTKVHQTVTTPKPKAAPSSPAPSSPAPSVSSPSPVTPVVTTPVKPKPTYAKGTLVVRFGDATGDSLPRLVVPKLGALPKETTGEETPLLVYIGLTDHGKKAVFMVDESLEPTGDGDCKPHPSSCETIQLAKGETEFFDVVDDATGTVTAQYELDLVDIK